MIRRLYIFILIMLTTAISIQAKHVSFNRSADTYLKSINQKRHESDSLKKIGKYGEALKKIFEARQIAFQASFHITENQINSLNVKMEYYQRKEADRLLQWKYDSLMMQTKILEAKHKKVFQETKEAQHHVTISMDRERLELEKQEVQLAKIRNDNTKREILKTQEKRDIYIKLGMLSMILFIIALIGLAIYMHQKKATIQKLKIKKIKAERARIASIMAKEEAEKAKEAADKSNDMKTTFIQNMSHEIRTPLNAIVGFSELLSDEQPMSKEERNDLCTIIQNNSDLLSYLINNIIDLTNLIGGYYKINYDHVSIQEVCENLRKKVERSVPKGVNLVIENSEKALYATTDKERVEQVLLNLLTNSCKYTTEGTITLQYEITNHHDGQYLRFSVTDTGIGIQPNKADKIFDNFEKLNEFKQGNGLGLSICLMIAELLKGQCWLDTSYDEGARFYFEIPTNKS